MCPDPYMSVSQPTLEIRMMSLATQLGMGTTSWNVATFDKNKEWEI